MSSSSDETTGFDDMFDDRTYQVAQSTFSPKKVPMAPHGLTYYRSGVSYVKQGMPPEITVRHQSRALRKSSQAKHRRLSHAVLDRSVAGVR